MMFLKNTLVILVLFCVSLSSATIFTVAHGKATQDEVVVVQSTPIQVTGKQEERTERRENESNEDINGEGDLNKNKETNSVASQPLKLCGKDDQTCSQATSFLLMFYLFFLVLGRLFWVVEPNNQYLKTHADRIDVRLEIEHDPNAPVVDGICRIKSYLKHVKEELNKPLWKWCIAFTGRQMSAWRALHEAERLAIDFYSPEVIRDQANLILDKLRETQTATTTLEAELRKGLEEGNTDLKALVKEAKSTIYRDEDERFEALADAQNKALWLVFMAAVILFGLSWIFVEAQVLFLAGAAGGLLARLRKVVTKRSLPFDYGVSWTVLFLTPLVGALTGWAGTLLFVLLQSWGLIGEQFKNISVDNPTWASVMVALVFGYSATLFEKFVEQLEESISKK